MKVRLTTNSSGMLERFSSCYSVCLQHKAKLFHVLRDNGAFVHYMHPAATNAEPITTKMTLNDQKSK